MFQLLEKLRTRFASLIVKDFFSFFFKERRKHLAFARSLIKIYPKPDDMQSLGNYEIPKTILNSLNSESLVITGGVEFHIEFEELLENITNSQFHFFEVDSRSIEWFNKHKTRKNFHIISKGLGAQKGSLPVYGNPLMGWSSSVDPKIYNGSMLNWEKIGDTEITTIKDYCDEVGIKIIDLLKLDIEGMAREVVLSAWDDDIFPRNILLEIERGEKEKFEMYQNDIEYFLNRARELGYRIIFLERSDSFNSFTLEFFLSRAS